MSKVFAWLIPLLMTSGGQAFEASKNSDQNEVRLRLGGPAKELRWSFEKLRLHNSKNEILVNSESPGELKIQWSESLQVFVLQNSQKNTKPQMLKLVDVFPLKVSMQKAQLFSSRSHDHNPSKRVPSEMWVTREQGSLEVFTKLPFREYLLGVLQREMPGRWPMEALKAQAVATRSYTLAQMRERQAQSFDLDASIMDQEFEYVDPREPQTEILDRWSQALKETASLKLYNKKSEILKAYYHADCGGRTTTPDFVWGPQADFQSVRDPSCEKRPRNQWKMRAKKSWLRERLAGAESSRAPAAEVNKAGLKFDWIQSLFDQRITLVEWWDGFGDLQILTGQNFRQLLGFGELRSLRFQTKDLGDSVEFQGRGFGHGVGLCQWGSKDWAEKGLKAEEILRHYYPLARLSRR